MRTMACFMGIVLIFADLGQFVLFMAGILQFADASQAMGTLPIGHFFITLVFVAAGIGLFCIGYFAKPKEA